MAANRRKTIVGADLAAIVKSAGDVARAERSSSQSRKEAEFQRAVANGMSYDDQVKFRERQLKEEKESTFGDDDYVAKLEKSISDTKRLGRFSKYRSRYAENLASQVAGKQSEEDTLASLKQMLEGVTDPDLRTEILGDIATAEQNVKDYRAAILENHVKRAKYDGTAKVLTDAISEVESSRLQATIDGNEEDVSAHDETLAALRGQLDTVRVNDAINAYQVRSSTRGVSAASKLDFLNGELTKANPNVPVKIGDRNYASAQAFWAEQRDQYLAGSSETFGSFLNEVKQEVKDGLNVASAKFGYPNQVALDVAKATFDAVRNRPEAQPYLAQLDAAQADVLLPAVNTLANSVVDIGTNNLTFREADQTLKDITRKYGIDTTTYRLALDKNAISIIDSEKGLTEAEKIALAPETEDIRLPEVKPPAEPAKAPAATAAASGYTGNSVVDYLASVKQPNDFGSRKKLAEAAGIQDYAGNAEQNNELLRVLRAKESSAAAPAAPAASAPAPAPAPAAKKMATLVNLNLPETDPNRRRAVEVDSDESRNLFSQGYVLETK